MGATEGKSALIFVYPFAVEFQDKMKPEETSLTLLQIDLSNSWSALPPSDSFQKMVFPDSHWLYLKLLSHTDRWIDGWIDTEMDR
jgi:hypothetical protein